MARVRTLAGVLLAIALLAFSLTTQLPRIRSERALLAALAGGPNPLVDLEARVATLRSDLPARGQVGLVTSPEEGVQAALLGWVAQYALAPVVLDRSAPPGAAIAVAATGSQLDVLLVRTRWRVLRRAGANVALVDTSARVDPAGARDSAIDPP